jgi:hypothetical protein
MAIQRRSRDISAQHVIGEEVYLPLVAHPTAHHGMNSSEIQATKRSIRLGSAKRAPQDTDKNSVSGFPVVSRVWKESMGVLSAGSSVGVISDHLLDEDSLAHHKKKSRLLLTDDTESGEDEEGCHDGYSESDDTNSEYYSTAVTSERVLTLRHGCSDEMRRCEELEDLIRSDLLRGQVRTQEWGLNEAIEQSGEEDEWCSPPVAEGTSYFYSSYLPESPVQGDEKGGGGSDESWRCTEIHPRVPT